MTGVQTCALPIYTSIIKTVQKCLKLEGNLTERDKAAPDFSGLLSLDAPRKDDIPTVNPLPWESQPETLNDLHRLVGKLLEDITGKPAPESTELIGFIQKSYNELFGGAAPKTPSES